MKIRNAFTMIELIFVIVVMGVIGKFGVEFLAQAYKSFIFANVNYQLQSNSSSAVEYIAQKLQYRIKDSVIARETAGGAFTAIGGTDTTKSYLVLEWVGADMDGFRGNTDSSLPNLPNWSSIIDVNNTNAGVNLLVSPETNTSAINSMVQALSYTDTTVDQGAIYFIGSNNDINGYGWDGNALDDQSIAVMHPIKSTNTNLTYFIPRKGSDGTTNSLTGVQVYEYFKYSWTAYAVVYTPAAKNKGTLTLWYDYQPWNGENSEEDGKHAIIMENVSTFQFISSGSILKIQVCTKTDLIEEYSLCKEKTIF